MGDVVVRNGAGCLNRDTVEWHALMPPAENLRYASSVIGLDGTPTKSMWDLVLGQRFDRQKVLDDDERQTYLKDTLGHEYVRTTPYVKVPGIDGGWVNIEEDFALFDWIHDRHVEDVGLVTSKRALRKYDERDDFHFDEEDVLYYGNLLSSNELATKQVGVVTYSQHKGEHFVKKWGAYDGGAVEREGDDGGTELSYTGIGNDVLEHMRESQTFQAVMRFGRNGQGARVYVHTNTLPDWVDIDDEVTVRRFGEKQRAIVQAINNQDGEFAQRDLEVPASDRWTRTVLTSHVDHEHLKREKKHRTWFYEPVGDLPGRGLVDIEISDLDIDSAEEYDVVAESD